MRIFLVIVHTLGCIFLISAVLLQSGRGGGVGAAFAGASGQIFGGRGASSFLVRITSGAAALFFVTSLSLSMLSSRHRSVLHGGILPAAAEENPNDAVPPPAPAAAPAAHDQGTPPADAGAVPAAAPQAPVDGRSEP